MYVLTFIQNHVQSDDLPTDSDPLAATVFEPDPDGDMFPFEDYPAEAAKTRSAFSPYIICGRPEHALALSEFQSTIIRQTFQPREQERLLRVYSAELWWGLLYSCWQSDKRGAFESFDRFCRMAVYEGKLVGYAMLLDGVVSLYVAQDWRKTKLGRRLWNGLIHQAFKRGLISVTVNAIHDSVPFFEKLGCTPKGDGTWQKVELTKGVASQQFPMEFALADKTPYHGISGFIGDSI